MNLQRLWAALSRSVCSRYSPVSLPKSSSLLTPTSIHYCPLAESVLWVQLGSELAQYPFIIKRSSAGLYDSSLNRLSPYHIVLGYLLSSRLEAVKKAIDPSILSYSSCLLSLWPTKVTERPFGWPNSLPSSGSLDIVSTPSSLSWKGVRRPEFSIARSGFVDKLKRWLACAARAASAVNKDIVYLVERTLLTVGQHSLETSKSSTGQRGVLISPSS